MHTDCYYLFVLCVNIYLVLSIIHEYIHFVIVEQPTAVYVHTRQDKKLPISSNKEFKKISLPDLAIVVWNLAMNG